MPPATVLSWWRGHPSGWWNPLDYNVASICVPIATHVPHAAGLAWGKKLRGEPTVAIVYFGDGATSEGAFHEGANFAGVMRAPLILFCNNNQWAISTPLSAQTAAPTLADKAIGYGHAGGPRRRRRRARRLRGDPRGGRQGARGRRADVHRGGHLPRRRRTRPPTTRAPTSTRSASRRSGSTSASAASRATSGGSGVLDDATVEQVKAEATELMRAGIAAAEAEPPADPSLLFEYAYADPPPALATTCELETWLS